MTEPTFEIKTTCECETWAGFFGIDETGRQPECGQEIVLTVSEDKIERYEDGAVRPFSSVECPKCKSLIEWPQRWTIVEKEKWSAAIMSNDNLPKDSLLRRPEFNLVQPTIDIGKVHETPSSLRFTAAELRAANGIPEPQAVPVEKDPDYDVMCKLVEIFEDTERYDKLTITLDTVSRSVTIVYEDLDDEWFHDLLTL